MSQSKKEQTITRDMLHQKLEIGDTIIFNPPYHKGVSKGIIKKLRPKSVTVECGNSTCSRNTIDVLKINEQIAAAKNENPEEFI